MAWSSPRTWVADEIVTKALLDTELRDNLNELALHDHSGGSGSGTRAMGGSATGLVSIYMRDGAGPGTPTGTISAVFTTGSRLAMHSSGGTVVLFATAGHEHTGSSVQSLLIHNQAPSGPVPSTIQGTSDLLILDANQTGTVTQTATFGGSGSRSALIVGGALFMHTNVSLNPIMSVRLFRDGTGIGSSQPNVGTAGAGPRAVVAVAFESSAASGSKTYTMTVAWGETSASGTVGVYGRFLNVREISVP